MRNKFSIYHFFSVNQKMVIVFLLVSLTGVFTIALSAHYYYTRATSQDFYKLASGASASLNNQLDQYFNNLANTTYAMAAGSLRRAGDEQFSRSSESFIIQDWLTGRIERAAGARLELENLFKRQMTLSYSEVESMVMVSTSGAAVSSRGEGDAAVYRKQWTKDLYTGQQPSLLPMERARLSRIPVVPFVVPIYSTKNVEVAGHLILNVTTARISDIMGRTRIGETGYFFILDQSGVIVFHPDPSMIGTRIESSSLSPFAVAKANTIEHVGKTAYLTTYTDSAFTKWRVVAVVPLEEMATGLKVARNSIIIVVSFLLLFVLLIVPMLTKALLSPIMRLNQNMRQVRRGDLSVKVDVRQSRDEFQMLSNNFSHMLMTLNELIDRVYRFQIREMHLELRQKDATIKALQNQINPHFLYNSLDIIKSIAFLEEVPKIERMVGNLASFFRYTTKLDRIEVPLRNELEHLNEYLEIIRIRFNNNFISRNYVSDKYLDVSLVKLSLQPIVENAVKYAVEENNGDATIIISAYNIEEDLFIEVVDNGRGIEQDRLRLIQESILRAGNINEPDNEMDGAVGLSNVQARLVLQYGPPYGLTISSFPGRGTVVTLRIPIRNRKNVQTNGKM